MLEDLARALRTAWRSGDKSWLDLAGIAIKMVRQSEVLELPPASERLITMTIAIDRQGNVFQDTQTHGNTWAEVYRGTHGIKEEIHRLITDQDACPFHPKKESILT